jgi:hypothetical protein
MQRVANMSRISSSNRDFLTILGSRLSRLCNECGEITVCFALIYSSVRTDTSMTGNKCRESECSVHFLRLAGPRFNKILYMHVVRIINVLKLGGFYTV